MSSLNLGSRKRLLNTCCPERPRKSQLKRKEVQGCSPPSSPATSSSPSRDYRSTMRSSFFQRKRKSSGVQRAVSAALLYEKYCSMFEFKQQILPPQIAKEHTTTPLRQTKRQRYDPYLPLDKLIEMHYPMVPSVPAIILSLILISKIQTPMHSEFSSTKLKQQPRRDTTSHLATYQGEVIRKSICNDHTQSQHPHPHPHSKKDKDKHSHRVVTETSQKCHSIGTEMKKIIKQFRAPFKSNSPNMKKKLHHDTHSNVHKPNTQPQPPKKKSSAQNVTVKGNIINKNLTETGPIIKKVTQKKLGEKIEKDKLERGERADRQKKSNLREEKEKPRREHKQPTVRGKKLAQCKSADQLVREKQSGTFDCTPKNLTQSDLQHLNLVGQGTFGQVYKSRVRKTGQIVAVKRVFQDPKYKNRQVEIVSLLQGDFTMRVLGTFTTEQGASQYLNIVMEYYESDLYSYIRCHKKPLSPFEIKLYSYQAFRGLLYIHSLSICHRDIKPHNLLVQNGRLVVCDFGSAKILTSEPNLPYICSRCYRAPELIFGANHYSTMIDIWSLGCVLLEMLYGTPLFVGDSSIDHLIEVIKILGTPTKTQVIEMNPQYDLNDYKFPKVKRREWRQVFPKADPLLLDLIDQIMIYSPKQRLNAAEALAHQFYDELREEKVGRTIQKQLNVGLFDFSYGEIRGNEHLLPKLIPSWVKFY